MPQANHVLQTIRKRLLHAGAEALADHELLALFLGWGLSSASNQDPIGLACKTLDQTNGLIGLARSEIDELTRITGFGPAKACLLKAAIELGQRIAVPAPVTGKSIICSGDVANWFRCQLQHKDRECMYALLLDSKNRILKRMRVTEGSWTSCPVDPKIILSAGLRLSAPALILVHNHPSGDPTPSREDLDLTERMIRAGQVVGVRVLDHIIVGRSGFYSMADAGLI